MNEQESIGYICHAVTKDCVNYHSYGEICVGCGCCSKDKTIRYPARLRLYQENLEEQYHFNQWIDGFRRIQKRNIKRNITYYKRRIAIYKRLTESIIPPPEVEQGVLTDWQGKVLDFDHLPENP